MDHGCPQSILSPRLGEIVLNELTGNSIANGLSVGDGLYPGSGSTGYPRDLADGNGWLLQAVRQADGGPVRHPVDDRPHKSGGIVHTFRRGAMIYTVEGLSVVTDTAARASMDDWLKGVSDDMLELDGRHFFKRAGQEIRFRTVRFYEAVDITPAGPGGDPKPFVVTLIAEDPNTYTYTQDVTEIGEGGTETIPNNGNTGTWAVAKIYGPSSGWTILDNTTGFQMVWVGSIDDGDYIEVNFFHETLFLNGNQARKFGGLVLPTSDFWKVPPGGSSWTVSGASATILSNSAWV